MVGVLEKKYLIFEWSNAEKKQVQRKKYVKHAPTHVS